MSKLPKKMLLPDFRGIETIAKGPFGKAVIGWIRSLYDMLQRNHENYLDFAEAGGWKTKNWRAKEAEAVDVAAGEANVVGDLMEQQRNADGTWTTRRLNLGS